MSVEDIAIKILNERHVMSIATVRPDGWPQVTIVGYTNIGLLLYFMVFPSSQKYSNMKNDDRIAIAVGEEPSNLSSAQAAYAAAHAREVTEPDERQNAWEALKDRHPNLESYEMPDANEAVIMSAYCEHVSVIHHGMSW